VNKIPHPHWANYAFPAPRYGQRTSNIVEQQNFVYLQAQQMPVLDMFLHIWNDVQGKVFKRHQVLSTRAMASTFSDHIIELYHHDDRSSRIYDAQPYSPYQGVVQSIRNPDAEFKVSLQRSNWSCTCGEFQNNLRPCAHAFALIHHLNLAPINYIAPFHTSSAWRQTYVLFLEPVLRSELSGSDVLPPLLKRKRGRPRKKRTEQGSQVMRHQVVGEDQELEGNGPEELDSTSNMDQDESGDSDMGVEQDLGDTDSEMAATNALDSGAMEIEPEVSESSAAGVTTSAGAARPPKHSREWVLEPVEQSVPAVLQSRTRSGRS
jgi:hypothetical protein